MSDGVISPRGLIFEVEVGEIIGDRTLGFLSDPIWITSREIRALSAEFVDLPGGTASQRLPQKAAGKYLKLKAKPANRHDTNNAEQIEQEKRCQQVWTSYIAQVAAKRSDVVAFRQHLPPNLLTEEEAWFFITSPLASVFGFRLLREWQIDPLYSHSKFMGRTWIIEKERTPLSSERIADGSKVTFSRARDLGASDKTEIEEQDGYRITYGTINSCFERIVIQIEDNEGSWTEKTALFRPEFPPTYLAEGFHAGVSYISGSPLTASSHVNVNTGHKTESRQVKGYFNSIVWEALLTTFKISQDYGWDAKDTLRFLLTGIEPESIFAFAEMSTFGDTTIKGGEIEEEGEEIERVWGRLNISVMPWVLPSTLTAFYKRLDPRQRQVNKIPTPSDLDLFEFVNRKRVELSEMGIKPTWQNLHDVWVKENSSYNSKGYRNFWRDYWRVKNILFPPYVNTAPAE